MPDVLSPSEWLQQQTPAVVIPREAPGQPGRTQLAAQNNNPGNLRNADGSWKQYATPAEGYQDLQAKIRAHAWRGDTLEDYLGAYAPPNENDTEGYIQNAEKALGKPRTTKLSALDRDKLAQFQAKQESSSTVRAGPATHRPLYSAPGPAEGLVTPGNIDLTQLPAVELGNNRWGTVNSASRGVNGKEMLFPTIVDGKQLSEDEAFKYAQKNGKHLGIFKDGDSADAYAQRLHEDWEAGKIPGVQMRGGGTTPPIPSPSDWLTQQNAQPDTLAVPDHPSKLPTREQFEASHKATIDSALPPRNAAGQVQSTRPGIAALPAIPEEEYQRRVAGTQIADKPLLPLSRLTPETPATIPGGIAKGAAELGESLTTPTNIGLMAGGAVFGVAAKVLPLVPRLVNAGFGISMLKSAYDQSPEVQDAIAKKDWPRAAAGITKLVGTVGMAALAGRGAMKGEPAAPEAKVGPPEAAATAPVTPSAEPVPPKARAAAAAAVPSPSEFLAAEPKAVSLAESLNPSTAKTLKEGDIRTVPGQGDQVLRQVRIDQIEGTPGNAIEENRVHTYQEGGYALKPELKPNPDGGYTIWEGHHRILSDVRNGADSVLAWVPKETPEPAGKTPTPSEFVAQPPHQQEAGTVAQIPTKDINLDPARFQYKQNAGQGGATGSLAGVKVWDPNMAGMVHVWRDPADGEIYAVNGHNRVDKAIRLGAPEMTGRFLEAPNAASARTQGALINIGEGQGTALDAAKLFRDSGITPADLEARGVNLQGEKAAQGLALSKLDPFLFNKVVSGDLPTERAAIIGAGLDNPNDQRALYELLQKKEKGGKRLTNGQVAETIRMANAETPKTAGAETNQGSLFGAEDASRSLITEKAEVSDYVRNRMNQERKLFETVGNEGAAARLGATGNVIKPAENAQVAQETGQAQQLYDKLSTSAGPVSNALNTAAQGLAKGENAQTVKDRAYQDIKSQLLEQAKALTVGKGAGGERVQERSAPGPREAGAGERSQAVVTAPSSQENFPRQRLTPAEAGTSLFDDLETKQAAADAEADKAKLTGEQLTAQMRAPISREEQLKKLKPDRTERQSDMFTEPPQQGQGSLFDSSVAVEAQREAQLIRQEDPKAKLSEVADKIQEAYPGVSDAEAARMFARAGSSEKGAITLNPKAINQAYQESKAKEIGQALVDIPKRLGTRIAEQGHGAGQQLMDMIERWELEKGVDAGQQFARWADVQPSKLSKEERFQLTDALEGRADPSQLGENVQRAYETARALTDENAGKATAYGVQVRTPEGKRPFMALEDYFPHTGVGNVEALRKGPIRDNVIESITREGIQPDRAAATDMLDEWVSYLKGKKESGQGLDKVLKYIVDSGQAPDEATAFANLQRFKKNVDRYGNMEFSRELNLPFYDRDPVRVIPKMISESARRLNAVKEFGQENEKINAEVLKIARFGGNADYVRKAVDRIVGQVQGGPTAEDRIARFAMAAEVLKLPYVGIQHASQGLNTLLATDFPTFASGLAAGFTKAGRRFAIESGAGTDAAIRDALQLAGGDGSFTRKYLNAVGLTPVMKYNRALAAKVGATWAQKNFDALSRNPGATVPRTRLEAMGIDPDAALANGVLSERDTLRAGKSMSDYTMFRNRPQDLPDLFTGTPLGKVMSQFKHWGYQQSTMIADQIKSDFKEGKGRGLRTLLVLGALYPAAGMVTQIVKDALNGYDREFDSGVDAYIHGLTHSAALGMLEGPIAAAGNAQRLGEYALGPAGTDVAHIGAILSDTDTDAGEKMDALSKYAIQRFGGPLRQVLEEQ